MIKCPSFSVEDFHIQEFILRKGEMTRLWVEINSKSSHFDGYKLPKKIINQIANHNPQEKISRQYQTKLKRPFFDFIRPLTLEKYCRKEFGLLATTALEKLLCFNMYPHYTLKGLGFVHQKLLIIVSQSLRSNLIFLDYYGLSPRDETQLTQFVKSELTTGKVILSFDNLYFKPTHLDTKGICNIDIKRIALG